MINWLRVGVQRSGGWSGIEKKGESRIRSDCSVKVSQNGFRGLPGCAGREKLCRGSKANRNGLDSLDSLFCEAVECQASVGWQRLISCSRGNLWSAAGRQSAVDAVSIRRAAGRGVQEILPRTAARTLITSRVHQGSVTLHLS